MQTHNEQPITAAAEEGTGYAPHDQLLLTADQVSVMLGIGRTKVYELMKGEVLPIVRIGTAVRVPRARLLRWIERNTTGG